MNSKTSVRDALYEAPGPKAKRRIAVITVISLIAVIALIVGIIYEFYINGQLASKYWLIFVRATTWKFLGQGLVGTVKVAVMSIITAFLAGMLLMMGRISKYKILQAVCTALIELSRGIPTLLFIYFFFLLAPQFGLKLPAFWKLTLPVAISASGVVAEVLRSGVNAVPKGQREAAISLGMSDRITFFKIIFPQAFQYVIPSLIAEIVIVLKDTTFAYVVNYADLMQNAKVLISNYDALLSVYLVVAIIYILINYALNKVSVSIAKRQNTPVVTTK